MCCGVAAIVLSDSTAYLTGYVASTDTPKKQTKNMQAQKQPGVQDGPALPAIFCDVICQRLPLVDWVYSARAPLEVPKEWKKQDTFNPSTEPR